MSRKTRPIITAGIALTCALGLLSAGARPAAAEDAGLSPVASKTFNDLAACMEKPASQLNVLYLLDASSSLEDDTDPQRLRGQILAQAIEQLGALSTERDVYYAVSSFDLGYQQRKEWSKLTPEEATEAADWAQNQYSWWGAGGGTNWLSALNGGLATMQAAPNAKSACQLMVWVTDGGINVNGNKNAYDVNIAAMEEICGTNPVTGASTGTPAVVDAIRSAGIHLVAVALTSQAYLDTLSATDLADEESKFSYLVPVSEGTGQVSNAGLTGDTGASLTYACGTSPVPDEWATGAFVRGASPIALAYQFSGITNRIRGGQPLGADIDVPGTFEVEPGINRVNIQLAGSAWSITGPDGAVVASSSAATPNTSVQSTTQGELVNVQIDEPALKPGTWKIDVTDPQAKAQVYVYALLSGQIDIPDLRVGESSTITVDIVSDITGQTVKRADYSPSPLTATATSAGGAPVTLACTDDPALLRSSCTIEPTSVGSTTIKAAQEVGSRQGRSLYRFTGEFTEQVAPQAAYPQVRPDQVSLTALDGKHGQATGEITIVGPEKGSGQVCLPSADQIDITRDVVDRAATYVFGGSAWGTCVTVGQGETKTAVFDVSNEVPATGTVTGAFVVELKSSESDAVVTQQVTFTFDTIRQGTPPPWLLALLIVLGLALPIALLYLQARSSSKLAMKGLQVAAVPVTLEFGAGYVSVSRAKPAAGQLLTLEDWTWPTSTGRSRTYAAPGAVALRAITPRNPLGAITARAQASTGVRVVSCRGTAQQGSWAPMGLNPAGEWYISAAIGDLAEQERSAIEGTLVAFVNPGMGELGERSLELSSDVQSRLQSQAWVEVREAASRGVAKPDVTPQEEWPGSSTGGAWDAPAATGTTSTPPPSPTTPPGPPPGPATGNLDDLWK